MERIVAEREANGPFADFYDFCRRVDPVVLNKRTVESLAKGGSVRLARSSEDGALPRRRRTSSTGPSSAAARRTPGSRRCSRVSRPTTRGRPRQVSKGSAMPGCRSAIRSSTRPEARVRKGDARPLRERPPAARGRVSARPADRVQHRGAEGSRRLGRGERRRPAGVGARRPGEGGRADRHRAQPRYTKRGELMGDVLLGGSRRLDRGVRVPEGDAGIRGAPRRRRGRRGERADRHSRRAGEARLHGAVVPDARRRGRTRAAPPASL